MPRRPKKKLDAEKAKAEQPRQLFCVICEEEIKPWEKTAVVNGDTVHFRCVDTEGVDEEDEDYGTPDELNFDESTPDYRIDEDDD